MRGDGQGVPLPKLVERGAPPGPVAGRAGIGSVSQTAWHVVAAAGERVEALVPGALVGHLIRPGDAVRYDWLPQASETDRYAATRCGIDVVLDDGTSIASEGAVDQYGVALDADAQGAAKMQWPDQWNRRVIDLSRWAGRTITAVTVQLGGDAAVSGWFDGVDIVAAPASPAKHVDRVDTRRGSHSTSGFSRGNTAPLVGLPHGGVFGLPMTDASSRNWPYTYHLHLDADAQPRLQAFATSHISSPWNGDHGVLQFMPSLLRDPQLDRETRGLRFARANEHAGPHRYLVELEGGISVSLTAGRHAIGIRMCADDALSVVVDHLGQASSLQIERTTDATNIDVTIDDEGSWPTHFAHVRMPAAVGDSLTLDGDRLRGFVAFSNSKGEPIDIVVGMSTIDAEHARRNARVAGSFDDMLQLAEAAWTDVLARVDFDGARPEQAAAIATALYRLHLYPNSHDEPSADGSPEHRDSVTGDVFPGASSANHGFWDTYRTCWPALALLSPASAASLADGFLQHYRDAGWTCRWSVPGPIDVMTGTSTDVVFGQLAADGVDLDLATAYESGIKNATVPSLDRAVGRPGIRPGIFLGYTPSDVREGLAWTLDDAINDQAIAAMAGLLLQQGAGDAERLAAEREYLQRRAHAWRRMLEPSTGMLLGRTAEGEWRIDPAEFEPRVWGFDYTETNALGTCVYVPHDGAGLADAHGGEQALGALLDRVLATEETAAEEFGGSYGFVIHEQLEARDVRLGMMGMSNQPAHHMPGMFTFAGRHDDAHRLIVEIRDRLFVGGDIGQGYPGDEDNGEMSAWYLFATIGLYPLVPASGTYLLTPPALPHIEIVSETGESLEIVTSGAGLPYIAAVRINGEPWDEITVPKSLLANGTIIEFDLADEPQGWARQSRPPALSTSAPWSAPLTDLLERLPGVTDDRGEAPMRLSAGERIRVPLTFETVVSLYTVTTWVAGEIAFRLEGELADGTIVVLDERAKHFAWDRQTRPFHVSVAVPVTAIHFVSLSEAHIEQLECFDSGQPPQM